MTSAQDPLHNRPGLPALFYRIGDYASFRQRMLSRLMNQLQTTDQPPQQISLDQLTTRASDDPAIALMDAVAVVADVLTFYQERIINEGYMGTATERRSVLELARMIGYELNPGVAASTLLAFTVDDSPGSPNPVLVPKGTQVLSVPGQEEIPQTFETSEDLITRFEWNALKPRSSRPQQITPATRSLYLQGINTQLQPGDPLLLMNAGQDGNVYLLTLETVESAPAAGYTRITWESPLTALSTPASETPLRSPVLFRFRDRALLFGNNAPIWNAQPKEAKRANGGTLRGGVFRLTGSSSNQAWIGSSNGLPTIDLLCLTRNNATLFAGTAGNGVLRSQDNGATWEAASNGITTLFVQSLYTDREQGHLYAGTPGGGVFRSRDNGENWSLIGAGSVRVDKQGDNNFQSVNTGLPNAVVRSLLTHTTRLVAPGTGTVIKDNDAGTTLKGVKDSLKPQVRLGDTITVANQSRIITKIYLTEDSKSDRLTLNSALNPTIATSSPFLIGGTYLFAGTDEGVYRSLDQGKNWELKGSPNLVIHALAKLSTPVPLTGKISTNGDTAIGFGTRFQDELGVGSQIQVGNQVRIVTEKITDRTLILNAAFSSNLPKDSEGVLIRQGSGRITTIEEFVFVAQVIWRVKGSGTRFLSELQAGNTVTFDRRGFPSVNVASIESDTSFLTVGNFLGSPLGTRREVPVGASFSFTRPLPGKFSSRGNEVYGQGPTLAAAVRPGDQIRVGTEVRTIAAIAEQILRVDQPFSPNLTQASLGLAASSVFAATDRGIVRSLEKHSDQGLTPLGEKWEFVNEGLGTDQNLRSLLLATSSGTLYTGSATGHIYRLQSNAWVSVGDILSPHPVTALVEVGTQIWASTAGGGGFRLLAGDRWEAVNSQLLSLMVTALVGDPMLAATRFLGFLEDADQGGKGEWPGFDLQPAAIDLDTLYPRIVPDSWVVLQDGSQFAARLVKATDTVTLTQFSLTGKATHVELATPLIKPPSTEPIPFSRRTTQVLATSEPLPLANESLAVAVQQQNIFLDPIYTNTIFLSDFVSGLQPQQRAIVTGQRLRITLNDIAGVFYSSDTGTSWHRTNTGLTNSGVTSLAGDPQAQKLYAGTASNGVFRSANQGRSWEPLPGLPSGTVQAIAMASSEVLLVGMAQGLFGYFDSTWHDLKLSQVHTDVRTIALQSHSNQQEQVLVGTTNGGVFRSNLPITPGMQIPQTDGPSLWLQTTLNNTDVQALAVSPDGSAIVAGTADGYVFLSENEGQSWTVLGDDRRTLVNVTALALNLEQSAKSGRPDQLIIWAGTAGSGVFRLIIQAETREGEAFHWLRTPLPDFQWEFVSTNLADLNIRTLAALPAPTGLLAGTATGGVFRLINKGVQWAPINTGLTSTQTAINPNQWVNMDIRAIAQIANRLFVAGVGTLIAPDGLAVMPVKAGDQLQLLAPPIPLQGEPQKWLLKDKDGFIGVVFAIARSDVSLYPAVATDPLESEAVIIQSPPQDQQEPLLKLVEPLQGSYDPATVSINANVVPATHGETVQEVLGSGDGTATNQTFTLKKPPLTYVSAATPSGSESTLEVRVNQVRWQEVPSLYQRSPLETVYIVRRSETGVTTLTFGDGKSGARLPSGLENVTAVYRSGLGLAGQVQAQTLSLLKTRPLGIREVTNPLPATGAADPETIAEARTSAPLAIRTLDRIVSLQDYEDFTRAFAGIGKAQAVVLWTGDTQQVHITVAANRGVSVLPGTALYDNLVQAINVNRDPLRRVQVESYEPLLFNLEATVLIDPRYLPETVLTQVTTALQQTFTFEKRAFSQSVTASEAIAAIQAISGVIAVDLDALYLRNLPKRLEQRLVALPARLEVDSGIIKPAQLLLLNPAGIRLTPG
jgi:photosystem II stability/assembly factor-like uncharacterized protein